MDKLKFFKTIIIISLFAILIPITLERNIEQASIGQCACLCGDVSNQGCGAYGCPAGTRRICECGRPTGGYCSPIQVGPFVWQCVWSCYCQPDPSCASQVCSPGQWDACGTHDCGPQYSARCNDSGTGWECVWNPSTCSGGGGGGGGSCTPTSPSTPRLLEPANGSSISGTEVTLRWSLQSWGNACYSRNNRFIIYYTEQPTGPCPNRGSDYTYQFLSPRTREYTLTNLNSNSRYCWFVRATNGTRNSLRSPIWNFTTISTPILDNNGFSFNQTCSNDISGNASMDNTNNPITFYTEYSFIGDNGLSEIKEVLLAIIPNDVRDADTVSEESLAQSSEDYFMARAVLNHSNLSNSEFQIVNTNSSPYYGASTMQGNLTNSKNTSTLININQIGPNSTYIEQVDNDTIRVYWTIQFEDSFKYKPNGDLYNQIINANIYSSALREYEPGQWVSSTNSNIPRSLAKINSWDINVQIPQVSISNPIIVDRDRFDINWSVEGYGISQVNGYMWTDDSTNMNILRYSPNPNQNFVITNNEPIDFSPTNIDVTQSNLGLHKYRILSTPPGNLTISTKLSVIDTACNEVTDSGNSLSTGNSWFVTADSDISSANIQNEVQDIDLSFISQDLTNKSYLSTFLTSIRESSLDSLARSSKYNFLLEDYNDDNQFPQKGTNETWYKILFDLITKNTGQIDTLNIQNATITTTTSAFLTNALGTQVSKYSNQNIIITGDLEILSNATCDTRSIFFVGDLNSSNGGTLNINPDFRTENSPNGDQMGCIFITKNNINILPGQDKNQNNSNLLRLYDRIDGFFITDGQFNSNYNDSDNYDGLYVKGSIIANQVNLTRQLGLLYDSLQPAEVFQYDSRYTHIFQNEFRITKFKIREKDFIEKIYNKQ